MTLKFCLPWGYKQMGTICHLPIMLSLCVYVHVSAVPRMSEEGTGRLGAGVTGCRTVDAGNGTWVLWRVACTLNHWAVFPVLDRGSFHVDSGFKWGCFAHTSLENNSVMVPRIHGLFVAEDLPGLRGAAGWATEAFYNIIYAITNSSSHLNSDYLLISMS